VNNVECEVEGNVSGEKSLFKKEGNSISGIMRFKSLYQTVSTDLTLRESKKSNGQKG
jgi:hypothetical protein